jgi:site-specific recombinase XerC
MAAGKFRRLSSYPCACAGRFAVECTQLLSAPFQRRGLGHQTRETVLQWIGKSNRGPGQYLFPSRIGTNKSLTTRHYARLMHQWTGLIGLDPALYDPLSLRRTRVVLIYRRTGNLRAVQLLLGRTKLQSTIRYLGIEVDDVLAIAEQVDI